MKMWKRILLGLSAALVVASPAAWGAKGDVQVTPPPGYRFDLRFTSAVPDLYYVLSGPAQSYARYRVNEQLRKALEGYCGRAVAASGEGAVSLGVHLESVTTNYEEIGAYLPAGDVAGLRLASFEGFGWPNWDREWDGPSIPERITKSVVLTLETEIARPGAPPRRESSHASATEVIDRYHWDRWAYDYAEVIEQAVRNAVVEVDRILRSALR
jgi:hypothetical protein